MIGIGIVIHNDILEHSQTDIPDTYNMLCDLISSICLFTESEYILIIRDNYSLDFRFQAFNITLRKKFNHILSVFIQSTVNDLTHAWNEIFHIALNQYNCGAVIMLNQDIIVTKDWQNFMDAVLVQERDMLAPMSNGACYQLLQEVNEKDYKSEDILIQVPIVQGFCYGLSQSALRNNMYDDDHYFDPEIQWDFNEEEWQQRNNKSGGRSLILKNAFIVHLDNSTWAKSGLRSTKKLDSTYTDKERHTILDTIDYNKYLLSVGGI